MKTDIVQLNLVLAWLWILLGFASGMVLGMFFHQEKWLGGYASLRRRMYRLGHISFFGLGSVNLLFWLTVKNLPGLSPHVVVASWAFIVGALTMPLCCAIMAHFPKWHLIFIVPVVSLIVAGVLTLVSLVWPDAGQDVRAGLSAAQFQQAPTTQYWAADGAPPGPWLLNSH